MAHEHEVIVVGAGPAGATTATILAQQGHDVLLLDRHTFPRDKTCGDAVPAEAVGIMTELGMGEGVATAVAQGEFYPLSSLRLVSPHGYELEAPLQKGRLGTASYVAPRMYFDALIQRHAVASGATFQQAQVTSPLMENGRVVGVLAKINGRLQTLRAQIVVGADGVTSGITRALRPKAAQHLEKHRAVALRAYLEGIDIYLQQVEFYLYKNILPGYAWIFPIGARSVNIGLGMRLDHFRQKKQSLEKMLQHFLDLPAIKKRLHPGFTLRDVATWQLNFGSQKQLQHVYEGAILVGDAAGFINPLTGGGIHNSMISAKLAAQTIDQALRLGDTSRVAMLGYEQACHAAMWDGMKRSFFIQRTLLRFPILVDVLIRSMKENSYLAQAFLTKL